jgi:hypothetical protein
MKGWHQKYLAVKSTTTPKKLNSSHSLSKKPGLQISLQIFQNAMRYDLKVKINLFLSQT